MDDIRQINATFNFLLIRIVKIKVYIVQMMQVMVYIGKKNMLKQIQKIPNIFLFRMTRTGHWRGFSMFRGSPKLGYDDFSGNHEEFGMAKAT